MVYCLVRGMGPCASAHLGCATVIATVYASQNFNSKFEKEHDFQEMLSWRALLSCRSHWSYRPMLLRATKIYSLNQRWVKVLANTIILLNLIVVDSQCHLVYLWYVSPIQSGCFLLLPLQDQRWTKTN